MSSEATSSGAQPTLPNLGDPNISWPIERSHPDEWHPSFHKRRDSSSSEEEEEENPSAEDSIGPEGKKSLAGIALRAFLIGTTLGVSGIATILFLTISPSPFWRAPFFLAALSLFHFLEFYVTAKYNTSAATVKAFLLSSNGWAYNVAHGSAIAECLIAHYFFPKPTFFGKWLYISNPFGGEEDVSILLLLGLLLTGVGQVVRTLAMAQAASNFNHHVQSEHRNGHILVKNGLYSVLRHPSYFGFFWWGLGTQMVLGNMVCFVGYALVLWRFFSTRIKRELSRSLSKFVLILPLSLPLLMLFSW